MCEVCNGGHTTMRCPWLTVTPDKVKVELTGNRSVAYEEQPNQPFNKPTWRTK